MAEAKGMRSGRKEGKLTQGLTWQVSLAACQEQLWCYHACCTSRTGAPTAFSHPFLT